jgi:NADH:ubiquinone oxidoreductase subunit 5 (chain L)/Multisubunit Na+/H+ antiporter, MnhA subunit
VLFLTAGNIRSMYNTKIIRRVTGAIKVIPVSATLFILGIFAVTGWPPFGMFVSELSIVTAGFSAGNVFASVMFIGFVTTVFIGFIYYATGMVFGEPSRHNKEGDGDPLSLIVIAVLVVFLLVLGTMIPTVIYNFIMRAAAVIQV